MGIRGQIVLLPPVQDLTRLLALGAARRAFRMIS
jgi:hypothetical protein